MGLSKKQVEMHIAGVERRLGGSQERKHHGYEFARLCHEVKMFPEGLRYLTEYLTIQERDFRAHKLMGLLSQETEEKEKALVHFNRSLQLKKDQREVILAVAKLYCELNGPPVEDLKRCLQQVKSLRDTATLTIALTEKLRSVLGPEDGATATELTEEQLQFCGDNIQTHIRLVEFYATTDNLPKALSHCLSLRQKSVFLEDREWLQCALNIAEQSYFSLKTSSSPDAVTQCQTLITILDHITLLFQAAGVSGRAMATLLLKSDKVLFVALQCLKAQGPRVDALHRVALRELCAQYYSMLAAYLFWVHWYRTGTHAKHMFQVANLCLLASLSFPPPNLDSILVRGMEQRQELEAWHTRACQRLCVVSRQLLLVSAEKGDGYLDSLRGSVEREGGKLFIIRTLFTENKDLEGVAVQFSSKDISYNLHNSYLAAETEHLMAPSLHFPTEEEIQLCDHVFALTSVPHLTHLLWLSLSLKALNSSNSIFPLLPDMFPGLKLDNSSMNIRTAEGLCLWDVEKLEERTAGLEKNFATSEDKKEVGKSFNPRNNDE